MYLILLLILPTVTFSSTKTWAGGTGTTLNWQTSGNWTGGTPASGDDVVFNTTGTLTFTTGPAASISLNSITVSSGTVTLVASTYTLTVGASNTALTVSSGAQLNIGTGLTISMSSTASSSIVGTLQINSGGVINLPDPFYLSGSGTFTMNGHIQIGNANGITTAGTASGAVQTTTRNYNTGTGYTYEYNGTGAQVTGTGLPTGSALTLIINNSQTITNSSTGVTLSQSVTFPASSVPNLTLTQGILTTTTSSYLRLSTTSTLTGGSSTSYVNGPLGIMYASGPLNPPTLNLAPIGAGGNYYPVSILYSGSTTGCGLLFQAFNSSCGGTPSGFCSLSTSEYWLLTNLQGSSSSSFTFSFQRPTALGSLDIITATSIQSSGSLNVAATYTSYGNKASTSYSIENNTAVTDFGTPTTTDYYKAFAFGSSTAGGAPTISVQPSAGSICSGGTYSPTLTATSNNGVTCTYQWQYSTDNSSWSIVSTGTPAHSTYSNATTATLSDVTTASVGSGSANYYRCVVTANNASCDTTQTNSSSAQLSINDPTPASTPASGSYVWAGVNTSWNTASNWQVYTASSTYTVSAAVPTSTINVIIPATNSCISSYPTLDATANTNNLTIESSATLGMSSQTLNVYGNLANSGTITPSTGTLSMSGGSSQTMTSNATSFYNLTIANTSGGVSLNDDATVTHNLTLTSGVLTVGANTLTLGASGTDMTSVPANTGASTSYINASNASGGVKQFINTKASTYQFPIGDASYSTPMNINFANASTLAAGAYLTVYTTQATMPKFNTSMTNYLNRYWSVVNSGITTPTYTVNYYYNTADIHTGGAFTKLDPVVQINPSTPTYPQWVIPSGTVSNVTGGGSWTPTFTNSSYKLGSASWTSASNLVSWSSVTQLPTLASGATHTLFGGADDQATVLPIELLTFTANPLDKFVMLNWETASELNNAYFTIEKTKDGINFENVTKVLGAGNSAEKLYYAAVDSFPFLGLSYYRLKQTDFDGKYSYSNLVPVNFNSEVASNYLLYPNPVNNGLLNLSYVAQKKSTLVLTIYDMQGKVVATQVLPITDGGAQLVNIDAVKCLSAGLYTVKGLSDTISFVQKVVVE